jgi:ATP-dependent Clp protease ATP-binding subunit ClpA
MFERMTDRARKVMALANQEAQRFNHEYLGTEHLLLGVVKEGSGVGANVLKNLNIDLRKVRLEVERLVKAGPNMVMMGKVPLTPRAKKVIEMGFLEARKMGHNYFGTEHLLLGLLMDVDGIAAQVLMNLGVNIDDAAEEIRNLLGAHPNDPQVEVVKKWDEEYAPNATVYLAETFNVAERALRNLAAEVAAHGSPSTLRVLTDMLTTLQELRRHDDAT